MIYLDHNATTPPLAAVLDAMRETASACWANPASVHRAGQRALGVLERARRAVGQLLGRDPRDVVFTSGGTEANNLALWHPFAQRAEGVLLTSRLEHPSVVRAAEALERRGVTVRWAAPEPTGVLTVAAFERAASGLERVDLVALQAVNHETGVIQPVAEVAELAHRWGARLHVDAVQALGRLPPSSWAGADLLSLAGHKIRGPKGIGALASLQGVELSPVLLGGEQERGIRPGTQDAALAAGLEVAARHAMDSPASYAALAPLRDRLEAVILASARRRGIDARRNGEAPRAPHVSNVSLPGWLGPELCAALDLEGIAVSSGSACSAGTARPSTVITAMLGPARARSAVRWSLGEETTEAEIRGALAALERVLERGPLNA